MFIDTLLQSSDVDYNMFSSISIPQECRHVVQPKNKLLSCFVTEYPRMDIEEAGPNRFVYTLFNNGAMVFAPNQTTILNLANELFSDSINLSTLEEAVLEETYTRLLKKKPTRTNRI